MAKKSIYSEKHRKLCALLSKARRDIGLTQVELARKLKKPQSFIAKYEGGERRLDVIELTEIAKQLKLDVEELIRSLDE